MQAHLKRTLTGSLIVVLASLFLVPVLWGQIDTGAIQGIVEDSQHAVIPGAQVTVTNLGTNQTRKLTTDSKGFYHAADLLVGTYQVAVSEKGFKTSIHRGIEISVSQIARVDFMMALGETRQEVVVVGHAPLLESETVAAGEVIAGQAITGLPLNGRQYVQLAQLTPGVLQSPPGGKGGASGFVANGVWDDMNDFELDGMDNNARTPGMQQDTYDVARPSVDALAQFRVETHNFSAEFGRAAGGVINASIKSGTNQFHGDLFEFLRNDALDARDYFAAPDQARPKLVRNQFGGTLGGPILRNRLFFFFSYEGDREIDGQTIVDTVPTLAERQGNFSDLGATTIYDPATTSGSGKKATRDSFPGNIIPTDRFDPTAVKVLNAGILQAPNQPGLVNNFVLSPNVSYPGNQYIGRIDAPLSTRDVLFGRYFITDLNEIDPQPFYIGGATENGSRSQAVVMGETHTFGPSMINELRLGYTRLNALNTIPVSSPMFDQFGINGVGAPPAVTGISQFGFQVMPNIGDPGGYPNHKIPEVWEIKDNMTLIHGNHTLKTGIDYRYQRAFQFTTGGSRGKFTFDGAFTQNPQSRSGSGAEFADFLLGLPDKVSAGGGNYGDTRDHYWGAYLQDDWKLTPNISLNMGLRYEIFSNVFEIHDNQGNFLFGPNKLIYPNNQTPAGVSADLVTNIPSGIGSRTLMRPDYNNFSPRLGIAWRFAPRTVLRAGAGIYYSEGINTYIGGANMLLSNPPYNVSYSYKSDKVTPTFFLDQGFPPDIHSPSAIGPSTSLQSYSPTFPRPYVADFTFDIQHQLPSHILLDVGYSGSNGSQLPVQYNANQEFPGPGSVNSREPLPGFSSINTIQPMDNSNYNALVVSLKRHFSRKMGFIVSYTYGKALSSYEEKFANISVRSDHNLNWEYSPTDFNVTNRFVGSFMWQLPYGSGQRWSSGSRVVNGLLGGWAFNGIVTLQGGLPFTPSLNSNTANTSGAARPNRIANGNLSGSQRDPSLWFNLNAFVPADASLYQYGSAGNNILTGPGMNNFDLSLFKSARVGALGESGEVEFRFEAFNAFNSPQFGLPNATVDVAGAGTITSLAIPMRELQFGMKILF